MTLHLEYMYQDPPCRSGEIPPALEGLSILSGGGDAHIYGTVMTPGRPPGERRPCAILLHGYPGYTSLFDIGQGLRRMGAVAVSISYRGCWGSEGQYTLSGIIEDAVAAAEWARTTETASAYGIDTGKMFFIGHSMGGFAAVNAMRRLPWICGAAVMAPYDFPSLFERGDEESLKELLIQGADVLRLSSMKDLYEDAQYCLHAEFGLRHAAEELKDRNLYFIGAAKDDVAPAADMIGPLWRQLQLHETAAVPQFDMLEADHAFNDKRLTVGAMIGQWMQAVLDAATP